MPKYHVYVYPIVRVLVLDIEADSQEEACRKAEERHNWEIVVYKPPFGNSGLRVEYADKIDSFLVDEDGDTEHESSAWYHA